MAIAAAVVLVLLFLLFCQLLPFNILSFLNPPEPEEVFEEVPSWNMPDLSLSNFEIAPKRADPGDLIMFRATIANVGATMSSSAELVFRVNNSEVYRAAVAPLAAEAQIEMNAQWTAADHGRFWVEARIEQGPNAYDQESYNNAKGEMLRISGGEVEPELEVDLAEPGVYHLIPNEPYNVTLRFWNPSFADISNIPVKFYVDSEAVGNATIDYLPAGMSQIFGFQWSNIQPGGHEIQVQMDLPKSFPYADLQRVKSWHVTSPVRTISYDGKPVGKWVSIGPSIINGIPSGAGSWGWVGRANTIAFHPINKDIMYVGSQAGGVWKTADGGDSWRPLTDGLLPFFIGQALIVDPNFGNIVYFGAGSPYSENRAIYKSIDGGTNWAPFLKTSGSFGLGDVNKLVLRYDDFAASKFVIFAATKEGLLRYRGTNPWATTSSPSDWKLIRTGNIVDIAVSPVNPNFVYAYVVGEDIVYTTKGLTASGDSDWTYGAFGAPISRLENVTYAFDVYWTDNPIVYTGVTNPVKDYNFGIYKSVFPHTASTLVHLYKKDEIDDLYNPFLKVLPGNPDVVYFSGVNLYKRDIIMGKDFQVEGVHPDMHGIGWLSEHDPSTYFVCCDGGVWRCTYKDHAADVGVPKNYNLRITQFYDFDSSQTDQYLMIGGTQDCGTIMSQGAADWKLIRDGDGAYSLIGLGNKVFYSENQFINSLARSDIGAQTGGGDWTSAAGQQDYGKLGLFWVDGQWFVNDAFITVDPQDPNIVYAEGEQVIYTNDGGKSWWPIGPIGSSVKGNVSRVAIQPNGNWFAGTNLGQIWEKKPVPGGGGIQGWRLVYENPIIAKIISLTFASANPQVFYVTYESPNSNYRVQRIARNATGAWNGAWITYNLNVNLRVTAVVGDGYDSSIVYVGTDQGVYRGNLTSTFDNVWHEFNDGLPPIEITDLLIDNSSKELRAATFGRGAWSIVLGP